MNGIIGFKKLRVDCIIGILPHERVQEQTLFVDIKVRHDFSACIKDDHIDATMITLPFVEFSWISEFHTIEMSLIWMTSRDRE